jgi:predicted amidohydrolase YtcJ
MPPDRLLTNANIYTLDPARPRATAIAISGERIVAIGDDDVPTARRPLPTEVIDLKGHTVIPGLVDAHLHFEWYALGLQNIDAETPTLDEALARVAERERTTPKGAWLRGRGWNQNVWPGATFPTAADLDRVAPEHPVYLTAKSGHAAWANSLALRLAGIGASTPDPAGGTILRDARGQPTGILLEDAIGLVADRLPEATPEEVAAAMQAALPNAWRAGLTGVHDFDGPRAFAAYQLLKEQGALGLRVVKNIPVAHVHEAVGLGLRSGFGDDWLRIGGIKIFADGALGPRTAAMIAPFEGEPDNRGIVVTDKEEMFEKVSLASAAGLSATIHAIGDRANHDVLDVYEAVRGQEQRGGRELRHRIEHVQLLHLDDYRRLGQLRVIASMQPIHATSDMLISDRFWGARSVGAYAWRTQIDAGAVLAFGSDCPVESLEPLLGIHAAVTRRRADGSPGADGWYPEQRLTVEEAVRGFTWGAAYAGYMEDRLGTLAPGKLADLVVLSDDIFEIEPMAILKTEVLATMIGGRFYHTML